MYKTGNLVKRSKHVYVSDDGRFVLTDLALVTSRRKGWRVADTRSPDAVGFVKTLPAAAKLMTKYVEAEQAGVEWPRPPRRPGIP